MTEDAAIARRVVVRGRVQGVGFRFHAQRTAQRLGVRGWVRNEPDGTVSAHLEGTESDVSQMLDWVGSGPEYAVVEQIAVEAAPRRGFDDFSVA